MKTFNHYLPLRPLLDVHQPSGAAELRGGRDMDAERGKAVAGLEQLWLLTILCTDLF